MAPDARVKDLLEAAPSSCPPAYAVQRMQGPLLANWEANMQFLSLSLGDLFFISAATGTLLLVEVGVLVIVGVI